MFHLTEHFSGTKISSVFTHILWILYHYFCFIFYRKWKYKKSFQMSHLSEYCYTGRLKEQHWSMDKKFERWYLSHDLHKPSSHVEHQDTAFTLSVLNWQGSHSFSDCVIACLSTMETIKLFSGKLFVHASMLFFKSPSVTILRQMGHLKWFFVLSPKNCAILANLIQKAWKQYLGVQHVRRVCASRVTNVTVRSQWLQATYLYR
jgi:hypothetical protein